MLDYCKAHHTQRGTHKKFFLVNFFVAIKRGRGFTASFFRVKLQLALVLERNAKKVLSGKLWRRHLEKKSVYNHDCLMQILFFLKVAR